MAALGSSVAAEETLPRHYPFKVSIGEQEATISDPADLFAVIAKPVKASDLIKIEEKAEVILANASPCQADGTVLGGEAVVNLFVQNSDSLGLVATLKKEPLKPGTYLLNVVAHGKTARIVFSIVDPEGKATYPKFSDVLKYLKGDS